MSSILSLVRKIKTTVMVENNKILVLGGMIDNHVSVTRQKVPLLGDIPILGHLFFSIFPSILFAWI
jgi:general secretion pathway protein D